MADTNNQDEKKIIVSIAADTTDLDNSVEGSKNKIEELGKVPIPTENIKNFKQQLKEAKDAALALQQAGKENTQEYRNAVAAIAELKDHQDVLNRTMAAFDPGNKLNALVGIGRTGAAAVQGVAGAFSLVGANSETALASIQKLQGLMAFTDSINQLGDLQDHWKGLIAVLFQSKAAQEANTVAQETATIATKGFGLALKGLGIGLIISAIAYLVTNWDSLKESVKNLLPGLDKTGETFDKLKAIVMGVGNAVFQYAITPIKSLIDLIKGDFKGAINDVKEGLNVVDNFQKGYNQQRQKQADEAERELHDTRAKALEEAIKLYKAAGIAVPQLEKEMYAERLKAQKVGTDEYNKALQEQSIYQATEYKKQQDKAKQDADKKAEIAKQAADKQAQLRKQGLERIKAIETESNKAINSGLTNERQKELADAEFEYKRKLELYQKYGSNSNNLTQSYKIQQLEINKKYDDLINAAIKEAEDKNLDVYEQKKVAINNKIDELLKNATEAQKTQLEQLRKNQLDGVDREKNLNIVNVDAQVNLTTTTSNNVIDESKDTPEIRKQKVEAIYAAEYEAEQAAYNLKLEQLGNNQEQIKLLTADHNAKLTDIERKRVNAQKELSKLAKDIKMQELDAVGNALSAFSQLAGENTVAGKAMAVASTSINTFESAMLAYRNGQMVPGPAGIVIGIASAAAAVATGLGNIKKILSVKVPGKGTGGAGSAPNLSASDITNTTAPTISASSLTQNTQTQDVRVINQQDSVVKVYVTDKDLKESQSRGDFYNNLSTF